jgi:cell fate regulator YaaT (PSP1 superfamily)
MANIISARFRCESKVYRFVYRMSNIAEGDGIIVRTRRGIEFGNVVSVQKDINRIPDKVEGLILRKAEKEDIKKLEEIENLEIEAFKIAEKKIRKYGLPMKLIKSEYMFDMKKVIFYFSALERIDFRFLLRDILESLSVWVELKQVSSREAARILGGAGVCGKILCCVSFLSDFQNVYMKSAAGQFIAANSSKLCGACGRLMCCLKYEENDYMETSENLPKINELVNTPSGPGMVVGHSVLSRKIKVLLFSKSENNLHVFFDLTDIERTVT